MPARATLRDSLTFSAAFALGLALAWPGVEARADSDLAPSSRSLTRLGAGPTPAALPLPAAQGESCAASDPARVDQAYDVQRQRMQQLAQAMNPSGDGGFVALDGRGYGYFPERNPAVELARLQREAQLQARAQAEAQPQ
jgi:hypothetical protein